MLGEEILGIGLDVQGSDFLRSSASRKNSGRRQGDQSDLYVPTGSTSRGLNTSGDLREQSVFAGTSNHSVIGRTPDVQRTESSYGATVR